jgi:parvulin-like peptidyl-prolyl isomerase
MPHRFRRTILTGILLFIAATAHAQLEAPPEPDLPSTKVAPLPKVDKPGSYVVARVNGKPIFQLDVENSVAASLPKDAKLEPHQLAQIQATLLQKLVERELLRQYVSDQKLLGNQAEVNAAVERLKTNLQQQKTSLEDLLKRTHQTEADLREGFAYELGLKKYIAQNSTDEMLQQVFNAVHEQLDGTERRVSHILLRPDSATDPVKIKATFEQAKKLREHIQSGDLSFEDAARKYSAGPSHTHGGDIGYIPLAGVMAEQFSKTAFSLKPGEISQPVNTGFGTHLIKVTDIKPGTKTWQDSRPTLQQLLSNFITTQLAKKLFDSSTIEYSPAVPHFKKGTSELEASP